MRIKFIRYSIWLLITGTLHVCGCGSIATKYPEGDFYIMVISDMHISNNESKIERLNVLFDKIKVFETSSFADDTNMPHLVVGFDTTYRRIHVSKMTMASFN